MKQIEFSERKSSTKIILIGFFLIILLLILFTFMALHENKKHAELNEKMYLHPFSVSIAVLEANGHITSMHRYMKDVVLAKNKDELEYAISLVREHEYAVYKHFELIKARFLGDKEIINTAYIAFVNWKPIRETVIALKRNKKHILAADITKGKGAEHVKKLNKNMSFLIDFARSKALEFKNNSQRSYDLSKNNYYILSLVIIIMGVITAFFVSFRVREAERSHLESEERFKALFNNAEISIWSEDFSVVVSALESLKRAGVANLKEHLYANMDVAWNLAAMVKVNYVNNATLKLFAAKNQTEFIKKIDQTFGSNAIDVFIDELCAIWNKQETFLSEASFQTLDGKKIEALISFQLPSSTNNFRNIPISIVDISEHKKNERKLKLSSRVFSDTHEGIIITDVDKLIIDVNPAFSEITGYSRDDVLGKNPRILSSCNNEPTLHAEMWKKIGEQGYWQGEIWNRRKNGEVYAELLTISSLKNSADKITNYIGIFTDITQSKHQQESMRKMAHYDALTGLPNRTLLLDRFKQAFAHAKRSSSLLAVCFLDLDDFKPVNDTFGHDTGDKLLIEVAHRLELAIRDEDTVSRLGGDEFVLLLGGAQSTTQYCELLERIIHSISTSYFIDEYTINIGASIGVSISPLDGEQMDSLLRQADLSMYKAKQAGKNNFHFFDLAHSQETAQRNLKLKEIKHALANHELCLYYQPKVNMASGSLTGFEALIRWIHPEKGLISPIQFLPTIEGSDLEVIIGNWVIEEAVLQLKKLNDLGMDIEISVNVSSMQFLHTGFFNNLEKALNRYHNVNASQFKLEVLESSAIGNLDQMTTIIETCIKELGVKIALDDFGTSYSSLSHLRQLPADTIKIDQSFVRDILIDPNDYSIVSGVIGLTKSFNRNVIAEGVETTEHGLMLLLMGCDNAQGYAISKPMKACELVGWIQEYTPNKSWIEFSQVQMTPQVKRIKQLELILNYCFENIKDYLQGSLEEKMDLTEMGCHFERWIRLLKQEQLFAESWVNQLHQSHEALLQVIEELVSHYSVNDEQLTEPELSKFYTQFEKLQALLAQYN